jgi:hypothetical protein
MITEILLLMVLLAPPDVNDDYAHVVVSASSDFEACGVADFDRDGDLDIVCGDTWYAAPDWTPHVIGTIRSIGGYRADFADLPVDVDDDGLIDVVSCSWHGRGVFWRRNPGSGEAPWSIHLVDTPGHMETAILADVDGDGTEDVLPNVMGRTVWYRQVPGGFTTQVVSEERGGHGIGLGDLNGDGRPDLLGPDGWFEATEGVDGIQWIHHADWNLGDAGIAIIAHDFDQDGLTDVFWGMGHDYGLYWMKQGRDEGGRRTWSRASVDSSWSQAHGLALVDLDGDGRNEVVTGKRRHAHNGKDPGGEDPLIVCSYEYDPDRTSFTRTVLSRGGTIGAGHAPVVVDLDADGDLDLVLPGKSGLHVLRRSGTSSAADPDRHRPGL